MSEFTKGPWILDMEYLDIHSEHGKLVAEVYYTDENTLAYKCVKTEEERANANLIAAAPHMLEALEGGQAIINRLLEYLFFKTDRESLILLDELNQQGAVNNKAIAKAKGESQ